MNKTVPIVLWSLVLVCGGIAAYYALNNNQNGIVVGGGSGDQPGAAFADVKWEHFQDVPRFQLTNQDGKKLDSSELAGRPMVISFFFATCPTICRDLNKQVQNLRKELSDPELIFLTVTVDPENDTPEVLKRYAEDFGASSDDWNFLTGAMHKIKQLGSHTFNLNISKDHHTDDILLIDRWGRFRDRFDWADAYDMKRFLSVAKDVLAEQEPPFGRVFNTRNVLAGMNPPNLDVIPWLREFHLVDQDNEPFYSRELIGDVWIANFFFVTCPGICVEQTQYLASLQKRMDDEKAKIVSISTDPNSDTPQKMTEYARKMGADQSNWRFLTGDEDVIKRIGAEYFKAYASGGHHSSLLFVVDRWGNVRGEFDWREPAAEIQMLELIDQLNQETVPPGKFERISIEKEPDPETDVGH